MYVAVYNIAPFTFVVTVSSDTESCPWVGPIHEREIVGYTQHKVRGKTVEMCQYICDRVPGGCVSIEYHLKNEYCLLQTVDRNTQVLVENKKFDYYERTCRGIVLLRQIN